MNLKQALDLADNLMKPPPIVPPGLLDACEAVMVLAKAFRDERKGRNEDAREARQEVGAAFTEGRWAEREDSGNGGW